MGVAPPAGGSQRNLARRVSFNESTIRKPDNYDTESQIELERQAVNDHKRHFCCNYCCAWTSIIIGSFVLLLLVIGIIFFSLFQSNMPDFNVSTLYIGKLDVNSTGSDSFLNADVTLVMNVTNKNSKFELYYSEITVETTLDDLYLGKTNIYEFRQKQGVSTALKPRMVVNNQPVPEADGKKLTDDLASRQMVINVDIEGLVHYLINGNSKMTGFPFRVICHGITLNQLDINKPAKCQVKLTPVS